MKYDLPQIREAVQTQLSSARFAHVMRVVDVARELALKMGCEALVELEVAAWLHDYAREFSTEELLHSAAKYNLPIDPIEKEIPILLHAPLGAYHAEHTFGIRDPVILQAIARHTLGCAAMGLLEEILYLADVIEPGRPREWTKPIRDALEERGLSAAVKKSAQISLELAVNRGLPLHPRAVETYNYYCQFVG